MRNPAIPVIASLAFGASMTLLYACGDAERSGADSTDNAAQAYDSNVELISPTTCTSRNGRLVSCAIKTRAVVGLPLETAVPLRTVFRTQKSGSCSTQYPLEVKLEAQGADPVQLQFLSKSEVVLRRRDGLPIPESTLSDVSSWTRFASLDQSCRVALAVVSNEPDVSSKAEAQAIIARLEADIVTKQRLYEGLLHGHGFWFMRDLAAQFHSELTNEVVTQLRAKAANAIPTLTKLSLDCGVPLTELDHENLLLLYMSLPQLGDAADWKRPDGTPKTLADFLGDKEREVLNTVERLASRTPDGGAGDEAEHKAAADAVERAKAKLTLARAQLATWLAR